MKAVIGRLPPRLLIEWPMHDKMFEVCSYEMFKEVGNRVLTALRINLIETPTKVSSNIAMIH